MQSKLNHFLYRAKYKYASHLFLGKPVDVALELSSRCDMVCQYCYHADQKNLPFDKGYMDIEVAKRIIRLCGEAGVHSLKFNWRGESTLNKRYAEITSYAKSFRKGSTFIELLANTNFNYRVPEHLFDGLCNLTKVKISYDSFIKEAFAKNRQGGIHERITKNIDDFYNYPKRTNTEMVIQAVRTEHNKDEDLAGEIQKRWPGVTASIRDMVQGRNESTTEGFKKIDPKKRKPCLQAFARLIFNQKGEAYACCPDIAEKLYLGHIMKVDHIGEIFNGDAAKQLRRSLKDTSAFESDPCKNCSSYESYEGYKHGWTS